MVSTRYNRQTLKKDLFGDFTSLSGLSLAIYGIAKAALSTKNFTSRYPERMVKPLVYSSLMFYFGYNLYVLGKNIKATDAINFKSQFKSPNELYEQLLPKTFLFKPFVYTFAHSQEKIRHSVKAIRQKLFTVR